MPSPDEPLTVNYLTHAEAEKALSTIEFCIGRLSRSSAISYASLSNEICFVDENVRLSLSQSRIDVTVSDMMCGGDCTTFTFNEYAGFRMESLPVTLDEAVARLSVWATELAMVTPRKVIDRMRLEANAAIDAASAAATAWDPSWMILGINRPSPDTVQLQTYGGEVDGIYDADDTDKAVYHGAMSEPLSTTLNRMPYCRHIEVHDMHGPCHLTYGFMPYQQTLVDNSLLPLDMMRALARAEDNNYKLYRSSLVG